MKSTKVWKYAGLVLCGGILLQGASCATAVTELITTNLAPLLIQAVLSAVLGGAGTAA